MIRRFLRRRHDRWLEALSASLDGELSQAESERLAAHLQTCASCRLERDALQAVRQALRNQPQEHAPRSFRLSPEVAAARPTGPARPPVIALRLSQGVAVVAVVAFATVLGIDFTSGNGTGATRASAPIAVESPAAAQATVAPSHTPIAVPTAPPSPHAPATGPGIAVPTVGNVHAQSLPERSSVTPSASPTPPPTIVSGATVFASGKNASPTTPGAARAHEQFAPAPQAQPKAVTSNEAGWYRPSEIGLAVVAVIATLAAVILAVIRRRADASR